MPKPSRAFNGPYEGVHTEKIAFPLGGIGAGMICLEGRGALSHVSLRHRPDVGNEPLVFSAVHVRGAAPAARVLEGPVPGWKVFARAGSGRGWGGRHYGLPRFVEATFEARFPFGTVCLADPKMPLRVRLTGWSPFTPGDADSASLPVAALEYEFENGSDGPVEAIYSFHARNFLAASNDAPGRSVGAVEGGFVLRQAGTEERPWNDAALAAMVCEDGVAVNCRWFRGGWFDPLSVLWREVTAGEAPSRPPVTEGEPSGGGSLFVPFALGPGEKRTVRLLLCWYVPNSELCTGGDCQTPGSPSYRPWYAGRFDGIEAVAAFWREHCDALRHRTRQFTDCLYDTTLPPEVVEAVGANLAIIKSPTVLRQADGRLWCWEGCCDSAGCCPGSCSHVWNYAQAIPHLFPGLERTLRETEFGESQDDGGHQNFRAWLPIRPADHEFHAAADGQLGGIMRVHREWRICGQTDWLRGIWPRVAASLDYCIEAWDPAGEGLLREAHHNTYDIEFWGADGMCSSIYLGALKAAAAMAEALNEDASRYEALYEKGTAAVETELFDGEYFFQRTQWTGLRTGPMEQAGRHWNTSYSPDAKALFETEGPKYQYGTGCLSDGVIGAWLAEVCGLDEVLDGEKVAGHLRSVHRYNFRSDLSDHSNCQRPGFALGDEAGLLLCSWPKGGKPTLPFPYSDEVWTGIEYQAAAHMILRGLVAEGLEVVRGARSRYDGRVRDPFNEYECGYWYARALSSFSLLQALTGARYDAVERTLHVAPRIDGDWRAPLFTARGYGTVGVRGGEPFLEVRSGSIEIERTCLRGG